MNLRHWWGRWHHATRARKEAEHREAVAEREVKTPLREIRARNHLADAVREKVRRELNEGFQ